MTYVIMDKINYGCFDSECVLTVLYIVHKINKNNNLHQMISTNKAFYINFTLYSHIYIYKASLKVITKYHIIHMMMIMAT